MKKKGLLSLIMLVPALFGLTLTSCDDKKKDNDIVDVLTPYTNEFSKKIDIEKKLADKEKALGRKADFKKDLITEVHHIDHYTDGDTFTANILCDGNYINQALRFYNVDTPETHHPEKGTEPWGMAASQYTEMTLQKAVDEGKKIILEAGATGVESTYNRVVAYIWVDGILLNMALAEIGLATYGQSNASQEMYSDEIFQANWYRVPKNGYAEEFGDNILRGQRKDPNWAYKPDCGNNPVETNVCIKNKEYQYKFQEVGPQYPIPEE